MRIILVGYGKMGRLIEETAVAAGDSVVGIFDETTQAAVEAFQREFGLSPNGLVGATTWNRIASLYEDLTVGMERQPGQNPGYTLMQEASS